MSQTPEPITPPAQRWFPLAMDRLVLRAFRDEDLNDIHDYGRDPEVARYMTWGPNSPQDTRRFLDDQLERERAWPRLDVGVALELAAERRVIGSAGLRIGDPANRTGDLGYCLNRAYWGLGLASEAAAALARTGFETLGLHRLFATCDARNTGSQHVLEKLGMRREGLLLASQWVRDGWRDTFVYAVLADEWRSAQP